MLPDSLGDLSNLIFLRLLDNKNLISIPSSIKKLQQLTSMECTDCYKLAHPPYDVCEGGADSIIQYFVDMEKGSINISTLTVAVMGRTMAGKTSLIRTLQSKTASKTIRSEHAPVDETTKVFIFEQLILGKRQVRAIDFGGDSVYHYAYQLTFRDDYIPLFVTNILEFERE